MSRQRNACRGRGPTFPGRNFAAPSWSPAKCESRERDFRCRPSSPDEQPREDQFLCRLASRPQKFRAWCELSSRGRESDRTGSSPGRRRQPPATFSIRRPRRQPLKVLWSACRIVAWRRFSRRLLQVGRKPGADLGTVQPGHRKSLWWRRNRWSSASGTCPATSGRPSSWRKRRCRRHRSSTLMSGSSARHPVCRASISVMKRGTVMVKGSTVAKWSWYTWLVHPTTSCPYQLHFLFVWCIS